MTNENIEKQSEVIVRYLPIIEYVSDNFQRNVYLVSPDETARISRYAFSDQRSEQEFQLTGELEKYAEGYWKQIGRAIPQDIEFQNHRENIIEFEYGLDHISKSLRVHPDDRVELLQYGKNTLPIEDKTLTGRLTKLASIPDEKWKEIQISIYGYMVAEIGYGRQTKL